MPFDTGGIAAEMAKFDKIANGIGPACEKAVAAGGKMLAERLRAAAPVRTGGLAKSIKSMPVRYNAADGYISEVAPQKKQPGTGEPYAKIGNILEYGRSNMPPRPWFEPTVKASEDEVIAAMKEIIDANVQGGA